MKYQNYMLRHKPLIALVGTSAVLGVGASVVEKLGGNAGGINTAASFMPAMGSIVGGGMVLGSLEDLNKTIKRRR